MQEFSESDLTEMLKALETLQITLKKQVAKKTTQQSTQQTPSPESTTTDNVEAIAQPIAQITEVIRARTPKHYPSELEQTKRPLKPESLSSWPNPSSKRQSSPLCSPAKKRLKEDNNDDDVALSQPTETAAILANAIGKSTQKFLSNILNKTSKNYLIHQYFVHNLSFLSKRTK